MPNDRTGVAMIYPSSRTNPQSWFFDQLEVDSRTEGDEVFYAPDNDNRYDYKIAALVDEDGHLHEHLLSVRSTSGYDESAMELNHVKAKAQGYSHAMNDWKDVEMTAYIKFLDTGHKGTCFYMFARSGRHVEGKPCEGTKYAMCIAPDGSINGEKEMWHPGGYHYFPEVSILGDLELRRIGVKFVLYNIPENETAVMLECHVDLNADNKWQKMYSWLDTGEGEEYFRCGDDTTRTITWGGPIVGFRGRHIHGEGLEIDHLSVREISPTDSKIDRADKLHVPIPSVPFSTTEDALPNTPDTWTDDD